MTESRDFPHQSSAPLWERLDAGAVSQILKLFIVRPGLGLGYFLLVTWHGGDWGRTHGEPGVCAEAAVAVSTVAVLNFSESSTPVILVTFQGKVQTFGTVFFFSFLFFFKKTRADRNEQLGSCFIRSLKPYHRRSEGF